jgi:hypothetical protein
MTKQELAYNVLHLPKVRKSFANVQVIACYRRASIIESAPQLPSGVIELSDRTSYSAYAERMPDATEVSAKLTAKFGDIRNVNLRTFAENVKHTWISNSKKTKTRNFVNDVDPEDDCDQPMLAVQKVMPMHTSTTVILIPTLAMAESSELVM